MEQIKRTVYDFNLIDWETYFKGLNEKAYRARQMFTWLYRQQVTDFTSMTDFKQELRQQLANDFSFEILKLNQKVVSNDDTVKYIFELADGALIETVLMHYDYGQTVCVTTQVGCNMGCSFCASGRLKKQRNLTVGEMVAQVLVLDQGLRQSEKRVSNIVVMGIGEPFDNYDNLIKFLAIINHDLGLAIGARHITVSTCGIVPRIYDFAALKIQYNLAISLHAPLDAIRNQIMPINLRYPLAELKQALLAYSEQSNRRITLEYILLKDINDTPECVLALKEFMEGLTAYLNLIPYNRVAEAPYQPVAVKKAREFYHALKQAGIHCTLRTNQGDDIAAACGQLRAQLEKERSSVLRIK